MGNHTLKLSDQKVLTEAREVLKEHLPLESDGYRCTTDNLYDALLGVAVNRGTLQVICKDWLGMVEPETIRGYYNDQLRVEDLPELERRLNAALADQLPARVKRQPQNVAIDLHDRPYYGKQPPAEALWVRGAAHDGTTRFYRIATAYVLHNGLRQNLALHFVMPADDMVTVLQSLLNRLCRRAITISCIISLRAAYGTRRCWKRNSRSRRTS